MTGATTTWNPAQYARFSHERQQPFDDLLALVIHRDGMHVVDLGCGTGELTRKLHDHLAAEETVGIDNSETMLLKSGAFGAEMLHFERGDIEAFVADRPFDLVFSNAALQWVGDHQNLFRRLASFLAPHGQLAVQMPANDDHPSHRIAAEVAEKFGLAPRASHVLAPEQYAVLLHELGFQRQNVTLRVYGHTLHSSRDVIEWVKGTLLTDYQRRLQPADYQRFLEDYEDSLLAAIGDEHPYFYTYKRILIWGCF